MSTFYNVFIKLCSKYHVTPATVAHAVGISSAAISGWKNGKAPRDVTMQKIADYFGVTIDYLNGKEEDYYIDDQTAELAQQIFESPDLRVLFDTARDATPEDIKTTVTMLKALKKKDNG